MTHPIFSKMVVLAYSGYHDVMKVLLNNKCTVDPGIMRASLHCTLLPTMGTTR